MRIRAREFRIRVRVIARTRGNLCRARDDKDARARPMGNIYNYRNNCTLNVESHVFVNFYVDNLLNVSFLYKFDCFFRSGKKNSLVSDIMGLSNTHYINLQGRVRAIALSYG